MELARKGVTGEEETGMECSRDDVSKFVPGVATVAFAVSRPDVPRGRQATPDAPDSMHQSNVGGASLQGL